MDSTVDIQIACQQSHPSLTQLEQWVKAALESRQAKVSLRIVDEAEISELNLRYRNRQGPTNVLSFPFDALPGTSSDFLGDVVVCAPVVRRESKQQGKPEEAHWAHMVVHGILHLRGFDHLVAAAAEEMEARERQILSCLGYQDPYLIEEIGQI